MNIHMGVGLFEDEMMVMSITALLMELIQRVEWPL